MYFLMYDELYLVKRLIEEEISSFYVSRKCRLLCKLNGCIQYNSGMW